MEGEAIRVGIFVSGILGVVAFSLAVTLTSKWNMSNRPEINLEANQSQIEEIEKAIREGKFTNLSEAFPAGGFSKTQTIFGVVLSTFATVLVSICLVLACCAVL
jgi:hypothetical protein